MANAIHLDKLVAVFLLGIPGILAVFYLPGRAPVTFCSDSETSNGSCKSDLRIYVNSLWSVKNLIPYEYHDFPFCVPPPGRGSSPVENLGQVVFGDRIRPSLYEMRFAQDVQCTLVCETSHRRGDNGLDFLKRGIRLNYQQNWILDDMPVTWCYETKSDRIHCSAHFPVGCYVTKTGRRKDSCVISAVFNTRDTYYLFNHVDIEIQYQPLTTDGREEGHTGVIGRITQARLTPRSIQHPGSGVDCSRTAGPLGIPGGELDEELRIKYTYSVTWKENRNIVWSSRWDFILESWMPPSIMWFSVMNSLGILTCLSIVMAIIMVRIRRKAVAPSSDQVDSLETEKYFRWKLVSDDVFRPPCHGMFLAVLVGNGSQLFCTTLVTLVFAAAGMLSPANRGSLMTCALLTYAFMGGPAGYVSARLYKAFGGLKRICNIVLTAFFCQGLVFSVVLLLNGVLMANASSAVIPLSALMTLVAYWVGISGPLTLVGAYFGFRRNSMELPCCSDQTPRMIPRRPFYVRPLPGIAAGGILSFGCIAFPLVSILISIWAHQVYNSFGFLLFAFVLFVMTCSQCVIRLCYFHLNAEDYRWWWRSFLTGGSTAVYMLFQCVFLTAVLELSDLTSAVLYFGYTAVMVFLVFILNGSISFGACFWFVSKIYGRGTTITRPSVNAVCEFKDDATLSEKTQLDGQPTVLEVDRLHVHQV